MKKIISLVVGCTLIWSASFALGAATNGGTITIVKSTYMSVLDNSKTCDATPVVGESCNGQITCSINVNNTLCGDPDVNQTKELITYYKCSDGHSYSVVTTQFNTQLITCNLQGKQLSTSNQKYLILQ